MASTVEVTEIAMRACPRLINSSSPEASMMKGIKKVLRLKEREKSTVVWWRVSYGGSVKVKEMAYIGSIMSRFVIVLALCRTSFAPLFELVALLLFYKKVFACMLVSLLAGRVR